MRGIYQERNDDCVRACFASIFHLELDEIPDFPAENWWEPAAEWLRERGMTLLNVKMNDDTPDDTPEGYSLGGVPCLSDKFPSHWQHCVVCLNGKVVWCPKRGEMPGTERALEYTLIYFLNPFMHVSKAFLRNLDQRIPEDDYIAELRLNEPV